MYKLLLIITTSIILSSCIGPKWKWVSDVKPYELLERDSRNCKIYAYERFPANLYTINVIKHHKIDIDSKYATKNVNGTMSSSHTQKVLVPYTQQETQDANSTPREYVFEQCMTENGWYKVIDN
ncbi:MAG: hypothetical protein H6909_00555 [Rickettsiaceae bacterium]|nr:hypothetical protein [Rickettsiaceae bacterium]